MLVAARNTKLVFPNPVGKWVGRILLSKVPGNEFLRSILDQTALYSGLDPPKSCIKVESLTQGKKLVFSSLHRLSENSLKNDT